MLIPRAFIDFLQTEGRSLIGLNQGGTEVALSPSEALVALGLLSGTPIAILGGDVLSVESGKLTYTYENWYCTQNDGEHPFDYANRSQAVARDFIKKLSTPDIFVVLVYSELGVI